jgi:heme A synthase
MGSLVGLTTLALAILLTLQRRSMGALILVWTVGVCVALQGVMGGFRVTENNTDLAVVHGFFAHLILAGLVGVAALAAPRPEGLEGPVNNETDCLLSTILVLAILLQTLVGTFVRQKNVALVEHISLAMAVIIFTIIVGVRLWGLYPHIRVFARGGVALMSIVLVQLLLGGISLAMRTPPAVQSPSAEQLQARPDALQPAVPAILTTAHQTTAAVLLGIATLLAFWCWRLVWSGPILADEPSPAPDGEQL